jgi:stage II sporulation protein P
MIVIGTEHEHWQDNLAFAEKLEAKANKQYPGLIKSIRVRKDRRYNQHLHPRALLLEFGSDLNTQEDATNSAVVLAEIISDLVKGD